MGTVPHIALDIAAFNKKEAQAYSYVFKYYYSALCDFAARMVGTESAPDVVDDLFLKIWTEDYHYNDSEHLKAYLFRALKNACLDFIKVNKRAQKRNALFTEENSVNEGNYLASIMRAEMIMELYVAIAELPTEKMRVIKMTYLDGMTNQETADEMGISIQTVKNQKSRALLLLKQKLPKDAYLILIMILSTRQ